MKSDIENLYRDYLKNNKSNTALDSILSSIEIENIIKNQIKKLNLYYLNYEDLYQNCLIESEKLIKKYEINKDVPLKAYLNTNLKYVLRNSLHNNYEIKRGKGTQIKIKRAKELFDIYPLEKAKALFKEEFDIKKNSTVDKYFYLYNRLEDIILDKEEEELSYKLTDTELIKRLKEEVKLTDKRLLYVKMYFGLNMKKIKSSEIAVSCQCSKANISKELKKALIKIKDYKEIVEELKLRSVNGI